MTVALLRTSAEHDPSNHDLTNLLGGLTTAPPKATIRGLEHLLGLTFVSVPGHYIARSLLESGGFRPQLHPRS